MNPMSSFAFRSLLGLVVAGAVLLPASGAFAQTPPATSAFEVYNATQSGGDPVFSVFDNLTFTNLQITEGFASGFTQTVFLPSFDANSPVDNPGAEYTDQFASGSPLTSAVLTGTLDNLAPGSTLTVNLAQDLSGTTVPFNIYSNFSADLFNPTTPAIGLGQFALVDGSRNVLKGVTIGANAAPVPEASTTVSLGLLMALGLGALVVTRRRAAQSAS